MVGDRDLRASLAAVGPLQTGLEYGGELLDGRRRHALCAELGIRFEIRHCETLQEACSVLWTLHPSRALELAGPASLLELARLCGATTSAVAKQLEANKPKKSHKKDPRILQGTPYPQLKATPKMIRRLMTMEPELYAYAREAAAQAGHRNVNRLMREGLWQRIAVLVPNAPLHQPRRVAAPAERGALGGRPPGRRRVG